MSTASDKERQRRRRRWGAYYNAAFFAWCVTAPCAFKTPPAYWYVNLLYVAGAMSAAVFFTMNVLDLLAPVQAGSGHEARTVSNDA